MRILKLLKLPGLALLVAAMGIGCSRSEPPVVASVKYMGVPASPDSRLPNLEVSAAGQTVLSWVEPMAEGHALRFSTLAGDEWSEPTTVADGDNWFVNWADFPSVVPVSEDLWGAHWLVSQPEGGFAYDVYLSLSSDGGRNWSAPVIPHGDATPTEHGFVSIYPHQDGLGLVWLDGRNMVNEHDPDVIRDGMTLRSAVYDSSGAQILSQEIDGLICDCCQTDVAVSGSGPFAVYRDRTAAEIRDIYASRWTDGAWQTGQAVADDNWEIAACPVNGPAVDADGQRVAIAWFTGAGEVPRVRLTLSDDAGRTFSMPSELATGRNFGRVGIALLDRGDVAVSWLRKKDDNVAELVIARVRPSGDAGPAFLVSDGTDISGFSFPQLQRLGDDLIVAWTVQAEDISNVHSARVPIALLQ